MKEYDFNEIQQMQEKALERVKNMQIRARQAIENENMTAQNETDTQHYITAESIKPYISNTNSADYIKLPVNLPKQVYKDETPVKTTGETDYFSQPDRALLFSLLMLLKSDEASEELMMALLYIML